ncbi:RluA family pseudouridine synthase [Patescibacteria group bacterium]|nr:RluA family pseudouridine synthase [Patescibacteria group bacterium]
MQKIKKFRFKVKADEAGERLDTWLTKKITGFSRNIIVRAIKSNQAWLNNKLAQPKTLIKAGQMATITINLDSSDIIPEPMALDIIYQDKHLAVINKPAGIVMHPAGSHKSGTLANALKAKFDDFYLVHRLDKDTSGVVLIALDQPMKDYLSKLFQDRKVKKTYLALVTGKVIPQEAYLNFPIKRGKSGKFESLLEGRPAKSHYQVKAYLSGYTLVEVHPETGRTHQIRVHFKTIRHPVAGDVMYGVALPSLSRQFLHAYKIEFDDKTGHHHSYTTPLPKELNDFLQKLKNKT